MSFQFFPCSQLLTVVPGLNGGKGLLVLLNQIGKLQHEGTAVGGRKLLPGGILKRLARGLDSSVDILLTGSIDGGDFRFVATHGSAIQLGIERQVSRLARNLQLRPRSGWAHTKG